MSRDALPFAPQLLPSPEDDYDKPSVLPPMASSADQPRRKISALFAPPSVPSLLLERTAALVVGLDSAFVDATTAQLKAMGVHAVGALSVAAALDVLEEDISANGCITYDQILCEAERPGSDVEGGETLLAELKQSSWPASVVLVTRELPTEEELARYARIGALTVVRALLNPSALASLFTHLKRTPHEAIWTLARGAGERGAGLVSLSMAELPTEARATPLHITAMGVGMVAFLHVHAGRERAAADAPIAQTFEEAAVFECLSPQSAHAVSPEWIYRFVVIVMVNLQLEEELLVAAVVMLERALRLAPLALSETNWQAVLLAAIIVAAKSHYDESIWLGDFVSRLRMYPLDASYLHEIEMAFLSALRFRVIVRPSAFYRYSTEIAKLHDAYCPYRAAMSCAIAYRVGGRKRAAWATQSALDASRRAMTCAPCSSMPTLSTQSSMSDRCALVGSKSH